jgi:hypothetical protein
VTQLTLSLKIPAKYRADVERARLIAELLAFDGRTISIDDVRESFEREYQRPLDIGNATGHVFLNGKFEHWGYCKSRSPKAKKRVIQTWQLKAIYRAQPQPFEVGVADGERFCVKCGHSVERSECVCQPSVN